ncbi:MAG: hypothetical protein IRZ16_24130 [Myxococcaceae bacterium]|nr:hypothetical protein [Myxococcaceae bacterium]
MFLGYRVQLRFDAQGTPKWAHIATQGGGSSGQTLKDAVQLPTGELVYGGNYAGICEVNPDISSGYGSYLGVYSDETGELLRAYTFSPPPVPANSRAEFSDLELLGDGRVAVSGWFQGTFDFGGGPVAVSIGADHVFVAIYKF